MALRVALVGMGRVARVHLQALRDTSAVEIVGVFDQEQARALERAEAEHIPRVYGSWDELLGDATVQCVGVFLPHDLHEQFVVQALRAGKHVVCEKPLAPTLEECDRMLAVAQEVGRKLFPVHNRVYGLAVEKMHDIVHQGQIGDVVLAQTTGFEGPPTVQTWLATPRGGGGVLMSQAVHPMYALRWLLGDVAQVSCLFGGRKIVDMTAEDIAVVLLKFRNGIAAEMTCTFGIAHGPYDHSITLHGSDGYLNMSNRRLWAIAPRVFGDTEQHELEVGEADAASAFGRMWEDYARGILESLPTRQVGEDGKRAVEIVQAAYQSNRTGRVTDLPLT